ncbi:ATP-binding protein [Saccharicrinis aurantiacus]|uniref:ATP-binding protein n=1 Tax=Saccharicrinis aurantiacus TaxID=1849719 RepID=UPI002491B0AE|nr:AAA family ATPase [Saccharicrinis aurantiacus]
MRRKLMDEIDWTHRLIGIKGTRGIGKTNFILDFAKSHYGFSKSCLYVNLNNLYFTEHTITEFADEFRKTGGKTLILDQVYKYPGWSEELRYCYDHFEDLQIIFSGSTVMRLREENPHLRGIVHSYKLEGFSFREFLELKTGQSFQSYTLDELLENHEEITKKIVAKVRPLAYFNDYLKFGYYPFYLDNSNYSESLMKSINFILEIDISFLRQIELKYLPRLRKLLFTVAQSAPFQPNVSKLSSDVGTSRATVMNYLYYLRQARLIKLLYDGKEDMQKKPAKVYLHNPNLMYALMRGNIEKNVLHKTFFYNQLGCCTDIVSSDFADFLVNNEKHFFVCEKQQTNLSENKNFIIAKDMIETGSRGVIPLWLFGFLY